MSATRRQAFGLNLSTGQLAEIFGFNQAIWRALIDDGKVPGFRIPGTVERRMPIEDAIQLARDYKMRRACVQLEDIAASLGASTVFVPACLIVSSTVSFGVDFARAGFDASTVPSVFRAGQVIGSRSFRAVIVDQALGTQEALGLAADLRQWLPAAILACLLNEDENNVELFRDSGYSLCWQKPADMAKASQATWEAVHARAAYVPENPFTEKPAKAVRKKRNRSA